MTNTTTIIKWYNGSTNLKKELSSLNKQWKNHNGYHSIQTVLFTILNNSKNKSIKTIQKQVNQYIRRIGGISLTLNEVFSIRLYTGEAFKPINDYCKKIERIKRSKYKIRISIKLLNTVKYINSAINKIYLCIKKISKIVYRAINLTEFKKLQINGKHDGFLSTTKNLDVALKHGHKFWRTKFIILKIAISDSIIYANISHISQFPSETEVLIQPGYILKFTSSRIQYKTGSKIPIISVIIE